MKQVTFLAALLTLSILGCGHKEVIVAPDGSSAVVSRNANGSGDVHINDNKGNSYSQTTSPDGTTQVNQTNKDGTQVTETMDKNGLSMKDSNGESLKMSAGAVTEDILGVPFYPGSQESKSGLTMVSDKPDEHVAMSTRTTPDDPDKVVAFYKDKLTGPQNVNSTVDDTKYASVSGKLASGADLVVVAQKKGSADTSILITMSLKKAK